MVTTRKVQISRQFYARLAGFTILFYMVVGFISVFLYNRATNAEGTHAILVRIAEHASTMRVTILLELLESFSALVLAVTLYGITREESQELSMLALVCRVCEGLLGALGIRNTLGLLWLAEEGGGSGGPVPAETTGTFILMPAQSAMVGAPFFAIGSLVFAYLLLRGRIVPTPIAWLGVFASVLLVVGLPLQLAGFFKGPMTWYMWLPMLGYQIPLGLWLLIKGVASAKEKQTG